MHSVHGATRLALVPEDQLPIPPCCHDTTEAFADDNDDNNSLLENMMQPGAYPCNGSFVIPYSDRSAVDQGRGRPLEVSPMHMRGLRSGASLLDQNTHMTTVVEAGEEEHEDDCKPPPSKVPRSEYTQNDSSTTSASLEQTLTTVMEPIRAGIKSLADDFPSLSLFSTRTTQGKDLGTEIVMDRPGGDLNTKDVASTTATATKPSMVRRQITPCDATAL